MIKTKKILFLFGALGGGGAQRQFGWLINGLDRQKFEPIAVSIGITKKESESHILKYPTVDALDSEGKKDEFAQFFLYRKLKETCKIHFVKRAGFRSVIGSVRTLIKVEEPDIIFFTTPMAALYGFIPSFIFRNAKVIHGVRGNGILLSYKKDIYNFLHYLSQIRIDYFVGNSNSLMINARKSGFPKKKLKTIYNGVPVYFDKTFKSKETNSEQAIKIGYIGRFHPVKDHFMFIDAVNSCQTNRPFSVHLYGAGDLESELREKVIEYGLENKIFFEGWVSDVSEILKTLDIVCLTSKFEGFNNSISEAQMHGVSVITTDCSGSNEIVEDNKTGFVLPIGNVVSFSEKLKILIENDSQRMQFEKNAYKRSRAKFSIEKMVNNYESFFTDITK